MILKKLDPRAYMAAPRAIYMYIVMNQPPAFHFVIPIDSLNTDHL